MAARCSVRCRGKMAKPAALGRIGWHRARGHRLVLVTAGLDIYAVPLGLALGFDDVVATRAGWDGGRLTGSLAGPNLRGGRKLDALEAAGVSPRLIKQSGHGPHPYVDTPLEARRVEIVLRAP